MSLCGFLFIVILLNGLLENWTWRTLNLFCKTYEFSKAHCINTDVHK